MNTLRRINLSKIITNSGIKKEHTKNFIERSNTKTAYFQTAQFLHLIHQIRTNQSQNRQICILTDLENRIRRIPRLINDDGIPNQQIQEYHAKQIISTNKNEKMFLHHKSVILKTPIEKIRHNECPRTSFLQIPPWKIYPPIASRNCCGCANSNSSFNCNSNSDYSRHGYHDDCERAINEQILAEFNAAYAYLSMACYFGRSNVAFPGCNGFFLKMHEEEMGHAHKLIKYQNMRGGRVRLHAITCTDCTEWNIKKALEVSLEMEKLVKEKLVGVHSIGERHRDLNLTDMIVTDFISEQERSICELSRLLTRYNSMCGCGACGCSEILFDRHMYSAFIKTKNNEDERYM